MRRHEVEHVLRAAAAITGATEFVVIGSQSILGSVADPPSDLRESHKLDLFTLRSPDDATLIDGCIGEGSPFHQSFGYYAHGVGVETATLPRDWRDRLVRFESRGTGGAVGLFLDVHDLSVSTLAAGREKDLVFVARLVRHRLVDVEMIRERLRRLDDRETANRCKARLDRIGSIEG